MAKYSYEFKKKVVLSYLNGKGSYEYLANLYGVPASSNIKEWVKAYSEFGDDGLKRSRKNRNYSFNFKKNVVELYLTTEISYQELALSVEVKNPALITKWVNDYRIAGLDALKPRKRGRKSKVVKPKITKTLTPEKSSINSEYLKQLEDENLKLRIENAYLKELRRLRLEEETLLKERRELSTASEENSN